MTSGTVAKWRDLYTKYNPMNANKPASIADIAFDTGVIAERERIIKLLSKVSWVSIAKTDDESRLVSTNDLISLIKEGTNE